MAVQIKILSARIKHRGVRGKVEWDEEADFYRAVVKHQEAVMVCQANSIKDLLSRFRSCVNDFLQAAEVNSFVTEADAPRDSDVQL